MAQIQYDAMLMAALAGSVSILLSMYILLPALGLPKLDFTTVTGGWVDATGRYAKLVGAVVFVLGGIGWAFIYAAFWPWHSEFGGMAYGLIPFAISSLTIMPELHRFHVIVMPLPGFLWLKMGGPGGVLANLVQHLIFGLCLGGLFH